MSPDRCFCNPLLWKGVHPRGSSKGFCIQFAFLLINREKKLRQIFSPEGGVNVLSKRQGQTLVPSGVTKVTQIVVTKLAGEHGPKLAPKTWPHIGHRLWTQTGPSRCICVYLCFFASHFLRSVLRPPAPRSNPPPPRLWGRPPPSPGLPVQPWQRRCYWRGRRAVGSRRRCGRTLRIAATRAGGRARPCGRCCSPATTTDSPRVVVGRLGCEGGGHLCLQFALIF